MQLKKLNVSEMLSLSSAWVDPKQAAHQALLEVSELAALLPRVKTVHDRLLVTQRFDDPRLAAVIAEEALIDAEHDDLVRGIDSLCDAMGYIADTAEQRAGWRRIQKALLPQGRTIINGSYSAEAGHALQVPQRLAALNKPDRDLPSALSLGKRTVAKLIDRWLAVAAKLGELERTRHALESVGKSAAEVYAARIEWIRVTQVLLAMAEMTDRADILEAYLHAPLEEAARRASRRGGSKDDADEEGPGAGG